MVVLLLFAGGLGAYSVWALAQGALRDVRDRPRRPARRRRGPARRATIRTGARDELAELAAAADAHGRASSPSARPSATPPTRARRDLVAAVSHDLRTPLTSLRLLADAIEDDLVDADTRRDYLEQMSRAHPRRCRALIDDLFELSRLEAGDIQWSMQQVQLDELVAETVEAMRAQADAKRVRVVGRRCRPASARRAPIPSGSSACCST